MHPITVRPATPDDGPVIRSMAHELADHEGLPRPTAFTDEAARAMLEGPAPKMRALIAESNGEALGSVTYTYLYWPWHGRELIYVDDLIVREAARGRGVGRALMRELARVALADGRRVRWEVTPDNRAARAFYERLGASMTEKTICSWDAAAMREELTRHG
ncbi:MAG: GNAT family N-acetyltransferase [Trueperaceae bacterium]